MIEGLNRKWKAAIVWLAVMSVLWVTVYFLFLQVRVPEIPALIFH